MRLIALVAVALLAAGCASKPPAPVADNRESLHRPGCYSVDLFDPAPIVPAKPGVPPEHARYLGRWGNGVWNGSWCHDLVIMRVEPNGEVELLDMHAPSTEFDAPATAFRRKARIHDDGSLRFVHGTTVRRYEFVNDRLLATREDTVRGRLQAVMSRKGVVRVPVPRPTRLAQS
jgi:hypothetical protein